MSGPAISLTGGKVTVRDLRNTELGTVERIGDRRYEYTLRRIRGYAGSYAEAVGLLRNLHKVLPRTKKEQQRGQTRARAQPGTTGSGSGG